jgi:hypothetical protein
MKLNRQFLPEIVVKSFSPGLWRAEYVADRPGETNEVLPGNLLR